MGHYFIDDKSQNSDIRRLSYRFADSGFTFTTDIGLFSRERIDPASDILIRTVPPLSGTLLDMGCGYGCIGIALARAYGLALTQADVNEKAARFAALNCKANGVSSSVIVSDCYGDVPGTFDAIAINPPIHAGKAVTYKMYEGAPQHLNPGGSLYVVTLKKHGAESTLSKLSEVFGNCDTLYKKKGCYVFAARV
ncbi:MAG: methyltransferase [Oscillospiraceae bacterium]|jgi:16S rRNA (guanine1207-N2)-methyltransferase|nr:methyltransferase [Oscillospiraceae bacterium]